MEQYFRKRVFKIGVTIIIAEILVLAIVGSFYVLSISDAIDGRIESQVQIPGQLMNAGILNFDAVEDSEQMSGLVGEEFIEGMIVGVDYNVYYSLNPDYLGQNAEDIPTLDSSLLDYQNPSDVLLYTNETLVSVSIIYGLDEVTPRFFVYIVVGTSAATSEKTQSAQLFLLSSSAIVSLTLVVFALSFNLIQKLEYDLAEGKRLAVLVEEQTTELSRSNEALEQFAYVISHDLQEPLRMVVSYLQLIEVRYKDQLDDDANEFIDFAVDGAKRMREMIRDLLQFSRAGRQSLSEEKVDCNDVVVEVLANLQVSIQESEAFIDTEHLPSIMANRGGVAMVFQNLISNAIKFRTEKPPKIVIKAVESVDVWQFSITDNGIGIPDQHQDKIFDVFQKLYPRKEYPGTGIGLSICKRVIESLGGSIGVESKLNEGSTFFFTIPKERIVK
ncbi:MAG: hypothetical protein KAU48_13025 [Candidatus Thorarchaeota archaeon]|nr:hypothetical protein [Candidatus Thorarchaeota archaeon]